MHGLLGDIDELEGLTRMVRYIIGLAIGFLGGWLLWEVGGAIFLQASQGVSFVEFMSDPVNAVRAMASLAAFAAGLATLTNFNTIGLWLAGVSTFMFGVLVAGLFVHGTDMTLWLPNVVYLACLTALFLGLFITRKSRSRGVRNLEPTSH